MKSRSQVDILGLEGQGWLVTDLRIHSSYGPMNLEITISASDFLIIEKLKMLETIIEGENRMNHRTKEGALIPLAALDDDHLINIIKFKLNAMKKITEHLNNGSLGTMQSSRSKALYGDHEKNALKHAKKIIHEAYTICGPYILEASIRGLNVREIVCNAFGRRSKDSEAPAIINIEETPFNSPIRQALGYGLLTED